MATLTIQLPPQRTQTEFNLRRWTELLADPDLTRFEGRVDAGAREVWVCAESGVMRFFRAGEPEPLSVSRLCPDFPTRIELRPA